MKDLIQFFGLLVNNGKIFLRQWKSNLVTIFLPVMCILFAELIQIVYNLALDNLDIQSDFAHHEQEPWFPLNLPTIQEEIGDLANYSFPNLVYYSSYLGDNGTNVTQVVDQIEWNNISWYDSTRVEHWKISPTHLKENSVEDINQAIFDQLLLHEKKKNHTVLGAYNIKKWTPQQIEYVLQYDFVSEKNQDIWGKCYEGFYTTNPFCMMIEIGMNTRDCNPIIVASLMDNLHNVFLSNSSSTKVYTKIQQIPYKEEAINIRMNFKEYLGEVYFGIILLLLVPMFLYKLVFEKSSKLKEMMKLQGLKYPIYVSANVLFMFVIFALSMFGFWILGVVFRYRFFTQTHPGILLVYLLGVGLTIISASHLAHSFLNNTILAIVLGYSAVLLFPIIFYLLDQYVLYDGIFVPKLLLLIPTMPVVDGLFRIQEGCPELHCLQEFDELWTNIDLLIAIVVMYVTAFVYFFVGIYLEEVLAKEWGVRRHPLFFLECFFCCKCPKKRKIKVYSQSNTDRDVQLLRKRILDGEITPDTSSVVVRGLTKVFKRKVAVNNVYLHIKKNEVFGLLGPNGAGKTTLLRMLVGLYSQTDGEAFIDGMSISSQMDGIRGSLGYCPQFNILWNNLTAADHLLFYSRIKGVSIFKEAEHVREVAEAINLRTTCNGIGWGLLKWFCNPEKTVAQMSEGEKRRLAIGCALVGNPKLVILDEPTTGLGRRSSSSIWDIILKAKRETSVLLTTHSMEEADRLSDTICIMSKGNLVCCNNALSLKSKYGKGYTAAIHFKNKWKIEEFMRRKFEKFSVAVVEEFGNTVAYSIRSRDNEPILLSYLHSTLENGKKSAGIVRFQLNQCTLEDVFLNVIKSAKEEEIFEEKKRSKIDEDMKSQDISLTEESYLLDSQNEGGANYDYTKGENLLVRICKKMGCGSWNLFVQTFAFFKKDFKLAYRDWFLSLVIVLSPVVMSIVLILASLIIVEKKEISNPSELVKEFEKCTPWGVGNCTSLAFCANGDPFAGEVMKVFINITGLREGDYKEYETCKEMTKWMEKNPNRTQIGVCFTYFANDYEEVYYTLYYNGSTLDFNKGDLVEVYTSTKVSLDNAINYQRQLDMGAESPKLEAIRVTYREFPTLPSRLKGQTEIFSLIAPQLYCLSFLLLLIVALQKMIFEKEKKIVDMFLVSGMKKISYSVSWFFLFCTYSFLMSVTAIVGGLVLQIGMFQYCNLLILFFLFFLFGLAVTSVAMFTVTFVNEVRTGVIVSFVLFCMYGVLDIFLADGVFIGMFLNESTPKWINILFELIYPNCNFAKIFTDILHKTTPEWNSEMNHWDIPKGFGIADLFVDNYYEIDSGVTFHMQPTYCSFLYLLGNILSFLALGVVFEWLISRHYFGYTIWYYLGKFWNSEFSFGMKKKGNYLDDDLAEEKTKVETLFGGFSIRAVDLSKTYSSNFRKVEAVKNVNIGIQRNSCFVLIGPNGSGKTSMINCLIGNQLISEGDAFVLGNSVRKSRSLVHSNIGVCHQETLFFPKLTANEHIRLFCEIRGLNCKSIKREIRERLNQVNLGNVGNQFVGTFSGGMKRRLMCAIAMLGNPKCVFLDEPTTGVDPFSRRQVWSMICSLKKRASVFLSTHSMDEAEILGNKIAVLNEGELVAIGSAIHLKKRFGDFYTFQISLANDGLESLKFLVKSVFSRELPLRVDSPEKASLKIYQKHYQSLPEFILRLEGEKEKLGGCITAFGMTSSSLEDVLVVVTQKHELQKQYSTRKRKRKWKKGINS